MDNTTNVQTQERIFFKAIENNDSLNFYHLILLRNPAYRFVTGLLTVALFPIALLFSFATNLSLRAIFLPSVNLLASDGNGDTAYTKSSQNENFQQVIRTNGGAPTVQEQGGNLPEVVHTSDIEIHIESHTSESHTSDIDLLTILNDQKLSEQEKTVITGNLIEDGAIPYQEHLTKAIVMGYVEVVRLLIDSNISVQKDHLYLVSILAAPNTKMQDTYREIFKLIDDKLESPHSAHKSQSPEQIANNTSVFLETVKTKLLNQELNLSETKCPISLETLRDLLKNTNTKIGYIKGDTNYSIYNLKFLEKVNLEKKGSPMTRIKHGEIRDGQKVILEIAELDSNMILKAIPNSRATKPIVFRNDDKANKYQGLPQRICVKA